MSKPAFDLAGFRPTQGQLAKLLGRTIKTVAERQKDGGLAPAEATLKEHFDALFSRGSKLNGEFERARGAKAKADIDELKLAKMRGELVEIAFVEAAVVTVLALVRTNLLGLPQHLGPEVAHLTNENEATALIRERLHDALSAIAEGEIESIVEEALRRSEESAADTDAAADPDTD